MARHRQVVFARTEPTMNSHVTTDEQGAPVEAVAVSRRLPPRAANAATHGLTATKYLPEILGPELLERHRQSFQSEWQPSTPTQAYLVEELARHAAALARATPIEEAVLRTSARGLSGISDSDGDEDAGADRVLAAACGTEMIDRVTRYRRPHEKAFLSALARLRELRATSDAALAAGGPPRSASTRTPACGYLQEHRDARKTALSVVPSGRREVADWPRALAVSELPKAAEREARNRHGTVPTVTTDLVRGDRGDPPGSADLDRGARPHYRRSPRKNGPGDGPTRPPGNRLTGCRASVGRAGRTDS